MKTPQIYVICTLLLLVSGWQCCNTHIILQWRMLQRKMLLGMNATTKIFVNNSRMPQRTQMLQRTQILQRTRRKTISDFAGAYTRHVGSSRFDRSVIIIFVIVCKFQLSIEFNCLLIGL